MGTKSMLWEVSAIDIFKEFHNPKMSRSHFETQVPYYPVTKQWCAVIRLLSPCLNLSSLTET